MDFPDPYKESYNDIKDDDVDAFGIATIKADRISKPVEWREKPERLVQTEAENLAKNLNNAQRSKIFRNGITDIKEIK